TGRSTATRDSNRDPGESELESVKALVREGLLEAKKHNDKARELGLQIVTLEEEIKSRGSSKFTNPLSNAMLITWLVDKILCEANQNPYWSPCKTAIVAWANQSGICACDLFLSCFILLIPLRIGIPLIVKLLLS